MPIQVRAARAADTDRLQAIEDAADVRYLDRFRPDVWEPAVPGAARAVAPGFLLVAAAVDGGEAVGFVHVLEVEGHAHLEQLSVLPEHGRHGIGRALVDSAKREAAARGYAQLTLRTYADVPWNAPFYARVGFVESAPDDGFLLRLAATERRSGLDRWGRRIQMTAALPAARE